MALLTQDYYCRCIGMASELRVVIPDDRLREGAGPESTLILLSPEGESGLAWVTSTKLNALCGTYGVAAVLVPCLQGCYTDMAYGYPFYRSLKQVRSYVQTYLPGIPMEAGQTAIAGASAGGYAALKWAMEEPDFFACCASFSGLLSPDRAPEGWFTEKRMLCLYGDEAQRSDEHARFLALCRETEQSNCLLFAAEQDPGYASSAEAAGVLGSKARFVTAKGGADWSAWSDDLADFLEYWKGGAGKCR